jgi:hypothetical protein
MLAAKALNDCFCLPGFTARFWRRQGLAEAVDQAHFEDQVALPGPGGGCIVQGYGGGCVTGRRCKSVRFRNGALVVIMYSEQLKS